MLNLEVKLFTHGKEVSVESLVDAILGQVRSSVREELSPMLGRPLFVPATVARDVYRRKNAFAKLSVSDEKVGFP